MKFAGFGRKIVISVAGLGILIAVLVGAFCFSVINDLPTEILVSIKRNKVEPLSGSMLEAESFVSDKEIRTYLMYGSHFLSPERWLAQKVELEEMERDRDRWIVLKEVHLPNLNKNHCQKIYCYQHYLPFEQIPALLWKGLIGIEDYRFVGHRGIDPISITRAIVHDFIHMDLRQGGSTLTQQLMKNLFYTNEKKFSRKLKEMVAALYVETKLSKEKIIELYFNHFTWGAVQGIKLKGLFSASLHFFEKRPNELSSYEASILIALLKGPYFYHPIKSLDRLKSRTNIVFSKLAELKLYPRKQLSKRWTDAQWGKWQKSLIKRDNSRHYLSFWKSSREKPSFQKYVLFNRAEKLLGDIKKRKKDDIDLSIKLMIGDVNDKNRLTYYSKHERSQQKAITGEYHQVGSILKPLIYGLFLDYGLGLDELISTSPIPLKLKSGKWSPREAHKNLPSKVSLETALLKSYNRPLIRIAQQVGFERLEKDLVSFVPKLKTPLGEYPAQLLGAVELSIEEVFELFLKFVKKECNRESESNILTIMSDPKRTTISHRVRPELKDMNFFGKTGTSNNGLNNWFIGFDGKTLGVIWVGVEIPKNAKDVHLYGSSTAFQIFQDFFISRGQRFNEFTCYFVQAQ